MQEIHLGYFRLLSISHIVFHMKNTQNTAICG